MREQLKDLTKAYDKSENDLKALQSVGQVSSYHCFVYHICGLEGKRYIEYNPRPQKKQTAWSPNKTRYLLQQIIFFVFMLILGLMSLYYLDTKTTIPHHLDHILWLFL